MKKAHLFLLAAPAMLGWALWGDYDIDELNASTLVGSADEHYGAQVAHFGAFGETVVAVSAPEGARVYLYPDLGEHSGGKKLTTASAWVFEADGAAAGWRLAAGDLIGDDGIRDLVIAAPVWSDGGQVFVIDGADVDGDLGPEDAAHTFKEDDDPAKDNTRLIPEALAVGDFDRDGHDDLAIGSTSGDGTVYIAYGPLADGGTTRIGELLALSMDSDAGQSMALSAGDLDGDHHDDLVIGSGHYTTADPWYPPGRVAVIYELPADSRSLEDVEEIGMIVGEVDGEGIGFAVSAAGDLNQDGGEDLVFSAPFPVCVETTALQGTTDNATCVDVKEPRVVAMMGEKTRLSGTVTADEIADVVITSTALYGQLGVGLSTSGSINGDFKYDILLGDPSRDAAFVFYGVSTWGEGAPIFLTDADADVTIAGSGGHLSPAVAAGLDLNGDDVGDMVLSAPGRPWRFGPDEVDPYAFVVFGQE